MDHPFTYVGCFVNLQELQAAIKGLRKSALKNDIQAPHITFAYRPQEVDPSLFGKTIQIKLIGYGNDGENEGLKVRLHSSEPRLQLMIEQIAVPHITIAVSDEGRPVNTKRLQFEAIAPIEMEGKYGGYAKWGEVIV